MDAPKCKICGAAHWSNEPHQFKGGKALHDHDQGIDIVLPAKSWKAPTINEKRSATVVATREKKKPAKAKRVESAVVTIAHHKVKDLSPEGVKAIAEGLAKKRGRPKLHPDRKAYKAEKERARRAAAKKVGPK
jgi:hypothetical protein